MKHPPDVDRPFVTSGAVFFQRDSLLIALCVAVLAIISGPFGTLEAMTSGTRALFWGAIVLASLLAGWVSRGMAIWLAARRSELVVELLGVGLITLMLTPFVAIMMRLTYPYKFPDPWLAVRLALYVLVVSAVITTMRHVMRYTSSRSEVTEGDVQAAPMLEQNARLLRRLPEDMQGEVLRLTGKDHLVEVTTAKGVVQLRMRLSDAVAEMEPVAGHRVHRSHWVAQGAIARAEQDGARKLGLRLRNGDLVPVSRKARAALTAAGILE